MTSRTYTKPTDAELEATLTPLAFQVTRRDATEPPFRNTFWNHHDAGIYVDVATGEPLFSSLDKFESGTGWPSFVRPIEDGRVVSKTDVTHGMRRTEVRSAAGDSHLGHVFDDGPRPTGLRYCINSASLRFIPVARLEAEGYGAYRAAFQKGSAPIAARTDNACAAPAPGEAASCEATIDTALFSGGEATASAFVGVDGVIEASAGRADHADAVQVLFDPQAIAYATLLDRWAAVSAAAASSASSALPVAPRAVFFTSEAQRKAAQEWRARAPSIAGEIVLRVGDAGSFKAS